MQLTELLEGLSKVKIDEYRKIPEQKLYEYTETLHIVLGRIERQKYSRMKSAFKGHGAFTKKKGAKK